MTYVRKEQCPKCAQIGRDRHRDNFARYPDGGGKCYSCGYYERIDKSPYKMDIKPEWRPPTDECDTLPPANHHWLRQYLSDEEIEAYFTYSPSYDRHIFNYLPGEADYYWEGRSVNKTKTCLACEGTGISSQGGICSPCKGTGRLKISKVLSHGKKPKLWVGPWKETGVLVYVEDIISAIKVGRHWGACPLFGSEFPATRTKDGMDSRINAVVFWLDADKRQESFRYAKMQAYFKRSGVVYTELDPKACSDDTILEEVNDVIETLVGEKT